MSDSKPVVPGETIFKKKKQSGEIMVSRLRDWEVGETIWGYDIVCEGGRGGGKTFKRGESGLVGIDMKFVEAVETRMTDVLDSYQPPCVGFVWVATIDKIRAEAPDPMDPGEPPLVFAEISELVVKSVTRKQEI